MQLALDLGPQGRKRCWHANPPLFADSERPGADRAGLWSIEPGWRAECAATAPGCAHHGATARTAPASGKSAAKASGDPAQCRGPATHSRAAAAPTGPAATTPCWPATSRAGESRLRWGRYGGSGRCRGRRRRHCRGGQTGRTHHNPRAPAGGTGPHHRFCHRPAIAAFCRTTVG
jgi:hypothetical protein